MTPDRKFTDRDYKVEEFYWVGRPVVYINNVRSDLNYEAAVAAAPSKQVSA